MLIESHRHRPDDIERWRAIEACDEVMARSKRFRAKVRKSIDELMSFTGAGPCYAGVSWGKDSLVLAHMIATHVPRIPLIWVRVRPIENPDCVLVRDAFLRAHPSVEYWEIERWCELSATEWHPSELRRAEGGTWIARGTLESGFKEAAQRFGDRHVSGIRANESGSRAMRCKVFGLSTKNTSAPIGWWTGADVFSYLWLHRLPVHPAYACTMGGLLDRDRIRVAALGGTRGDGMGRAEWERAYYGREIQDILASGHLDQRERPHA